MSGKCVGWAMEQKIGSPVGKLVLVKLADNANDDGVAWPEVKRMVTDTELSDATGRPRSSRWRVWVHVMRRGRSSRWTQTVSRTLR